MHQTARGASASCYLQLQLQSDCILWKMGVSKIHFPNFGVFWPHEPTLLAPVLKSISIGILPAVVKGVPRIFHWGAKPKG